LEEYFDGNNLTPKINHLVKKEKKLVATAEVSYWDLQDELNHHAHRNSKSSLAKVLMLEQLRVPQSSDS
jgi:hypothetical protein